MSTASESQYGKNYFFSSLTEAFFNHAVELHVHWFVQCYKNEPMARRQALSEPMAMQLATA